MGLWAQCKATLTIINVLVPTQPGILPAHLRLENHDAITFASYGFSLPFYVDAADVCR